MTDVGKVLSGFSCYYIMSSLCCEAIKSCEQFHVNEIECVSIPRFLTLREDVIGNLARSEVPPFDVKAAVITKQAPPGPVADVHSDSEALHSIVVPFANIGDTAEQHRKIESDQAFVEPLGAGTQPEPAFVIDGDLDFDGEVLVCSEIVDDPAAVLAVDHVSIEPARPARFKGSNPRNGLTSEPVDECIVFDRKRDVSSRLRKHDSSPAAQMKEGQSIEASPPDLVHDSAPDRSDTVATRETESALDLWMKPVKVGTKHALVN